MWEHSNLKSDANGKVKHLPPHTGVYETRQYQTEKVVGEQR
jgi:hypothetical protein